MITLYEQNMALRGLIPFDFRIICKYGAGLFNFF